MSTQTPTRNGTVLLSPADAARMAQVSRDTIYREIDRRRFCGGCGEPFASYNATRRVVHEPRPCVECGELFTPRRSDRTICSTRCRWARKRRLKREREAAA